MASTPRRRSGNAAPPRRAPKPSQPEGPEQPRPSLPSAPESQVRQWARTFERRTYITFVSRARASQRLQLRGTLWMIALSVASAATLCASVISLSNTARPVSTSDLSATLFALATLVLSLITSALNYQSRSRDLFHSFRAIQRVSASIESLRATTTTDTAICDSRAELESRYQDALDQSENHTTADYHRAMPEREDPDKREADRRKRLAAIAGQNALNVIPIAVVACSSGWLVWVIITL
ncbi:SLATT domain-containing protein [Nocardioides imazamoxiresistens]|uniref:SLATT domain-containing protein n=1 Tax=Nocardioides imazamoxiresistens TaxID=3231893 RepID=UPI0034D96ABF